MSKLIAVWGPTGAPGRTTVAINVAAELADQGKRVLLFDADTYGGAIAPLLGLTDEASGIAALCRLAETGGLSVDDVVRMSQPVTTSQGSLRVLSGIVKTDRWPELSSERMRKLLEIAQETCDVVVVDVGFNLETDEEISSDLFAPRRNAATLTTLKAADCIIEVASADALGVARFIRAHDYLVEQFPESLRVIVVNKVRSGLDSRGTNQASSALGRFAGLHDLHELAYDDKAAGAALVMSQPLSQSAKNSKLRRQIQALAQLIAPTSEITAVKQNRFSRSRKQESLSEQSEPLRDSA